ncbi:CHASE domain-containing hybrid sensor histidine kinase/response regulator [Pseudomonas tohonis]|uniref:CHASE domain-containing hybrid sensor histidine kinase/response regulator n=1 Tax=Pseudomonas tohonis TaxID=2725477 RepID=UPI001F43BA8D|nr:CHASE domain-containing protein [Pseudomonas tohonis]GJN48107.1 histidine kinase [Pseudomonas tohonis]
MKAKSWTYIAIWMAAVLLLGLLLSALASLQQVRSIDNHVQQALKDESREVEGDLMSRLRIYEFRLRGWRGAIHMLGIGNVTLDLFTRYSRARNLQEEFPGARGFGFIRRVKVSEEADFLRRVRADGQPNFTLHQFAPSQGERYVIQYIDPPEVNIEAIGLDIASEPLRRIAAQRSMLSGKATLTAPITFINESREAYRSFLFLLPVYSTPDTPADLPSRHEEILGWSYAPLAMSEVMTDLDLPVDSLHLAIYDKTDAPQRKLIFETHHQSPDGERVQTYSFEREVYGRTWLFEVSAYAAFVESLDPVHPARVFVVGLLASLLVTGMVGTLLLSRQRQYQVMAGQARLATIVENSSDAIIGEALDGRIITWNRAAEQMFGYTEAEILGRPLAPLLVPQERLAEDEALLERVARGERGPTLETQRLHKEGRLIDVTITCSLIREADDSILGAAKLMHDISDRKRAEDYLRQFNASLEQQVSERTAELSRVAGLLQAVLDASSEVSIIAVDMQGEIVVFNRGAELLLGYTAAEMIGIRNLLDFHLPEEVQARAVELSREYGRPIEGMEVFRCKPDEQGAETRQWTYIRKGGSQTQVSMVITSIRTETGALIGHLAIAQDITERLRNSAELLAAKASAESANAAKSLFLANMSHEIRTPMNAVIGIAHLLQGTRLDEQQEKLLGKLQIAGRSLLGIINDILDIAKIEAGEMLLENSPFRPHRLFGDLAELFAPQAEAKGLRFEVKADALPEQLAGDALRLNQILMNLIGNALKFTAAGSIEVNVECTHETDVRCWLCISVRDTGCGIDAKVIERLFSPFTQADTSTTRRFGGTGLGLSVVRGLAEKMGGTVGVRSTLGVGSEFWVRLPFDPVIDEQALSDNTSSLDVLVVSQDESERQRLTQLCRSLGWRATPFFRREDLLEHLGQRLARRHPLADVLLLDHLAGADVLETLEQLRALLGRERMPSSVVFSAPRTSAAPTLEDALVDHHARTPLDGSDLYNAIAAASLGHPNGHGEKLIHATELDITQARWLEGIRLLLVDDSDINLEVASLMLQQQGAEVQTCMNGRQALDCLREDTTAFDVVLMDLHMPEMDGFEATRRLRGELGLQRLPVLALTAGALPEERRQAKAAGIDEFLSKPLEPKVLIRAIRRAVQDSRGAPLPIRPIEAPTGPSRPWPTIEGIDTVEVAQRMSHDLELFNSSLRRLFSEFGEFRDDEATRRRLQDDPPGLTARLHKLRGSAGMLGARRLHKLAGEAETLLRVEPDAPHLPALLGQLVEAYLELERQTGVIEAITLPRSDADHLAAGPALARLIDHLRDHDMAALEQFAQAYPAIRISSQALAEQVWQAIDNLDFEQALHLLESAGLVAKE